MVAISAAQLAYMFDGIDWRNPLWLNLKRQTLVSVAAGSEHPHVVTPPIQVTRKLADANSADNVGRWESERDDEDFHTANMARQKKFETAKETQSSSPRKLIRYCLGLAERSLIGEKRRIA